MECPACQHENRDGAKFCEECAAPLRSVCAQCGCELRPTAKFCDECGASATGAAAEQRSPQTYTPKHLADKILQSKSAIEGERKEVTVLFADVKDSMSLADRLDPEDWHSILDRFFGILTKGVHRFEGTINQYTGDGVMALFGAPIGHEDHAQRACYAALMLREELREFAERLRNEQGLDFGVRVGINSGDVVVGKIGDDLRMDYTAQGQTVGIAQRIEAIAEAGQVNLSAETAHRVSGFFELRSTGRHELKGIAEPIEIFALEGASAAVSRIEAAATRGLTEFVGRDQEMQMLSTALGRAEAGFGQVVGVVGDPGLGKSRLCLEFVNRCRADGYVVHEAHCPAHGRNVPFLPILELFRSYFGVTRQDCDAAAREKIINLTQRLDPALADALAVLFEFMGISDPDTPSSTMDSDFRQRILFDLIHRVTRARADRGETVIIMIDDLHWIDPGSDRYVAQIVDAVESGRVLLLLNFRPEYTAPWTQKSHYQQLPLVPLDATAVTALVRYRLGDNETFRPLTARLLTWTAGNPFFAEEVIEMLIETGAIAQQAGRYRLIGDLTHLEVPSNVRSLLAARIDRLDDASKRVLQRASVIGKGFDAQILEDIVDIDGTDLAAALDTLKDNAFIHETEIYPTYKYAFKHPLSHEVAYASQLNESRRATHAAVATALEKHAPDRLDETAALLAYHWEEAGDALNAANWYRRAAKWVTRTDFVAATRHWGKVRELVRALPDSADAAKLGISACMQQLSLALRVGMDPDEAQLVLEQGQNLADASGDRLAHMYLALAHGFTRCTTGDVAAYLDVALDSRRRLVASDDIRVQANVWSYLVHALWLAARFPEALQLADEGLAVVSRDGVIKNTSGIPLRGIFSMFRGCCVYWTGRLRDGMQELDACQHFAKEDESRELAGYAAYWRAEACYLAGDAAGTLESARQGDDVSRELGDPANMIVFKQVALAYAHLAAGRVADAVEQMREAQLEKRAAQEWAGQVAQLLAEALLRAGDLSAAVTAAREATSLCRRSLRGNYEALAHGVLARALLRRDGIAARSEIEDALNTVAQLIDRTGATTLAPFLLEWRAELAAALGDEGACEKFLNCATQGYERIGAPKRALAIGAKRRARSV